MHPFTQKTIKSAAVSFAIAALMAASPAAMSAQKTTVNKLTIVTTYKIIAPDGQLTIDQEAKKFFAWLAKQPDAESFLMNLGYSKMEAIDIASLAKASSDGQLDAFFSTESGRRLENFIFLSPWLVELATEALGTDPLGFSNEDSDKGTGRGGTHGGAPNPCGKPPGLIDKKTGEDDLASAQAAAKAFEAGLSNSSHRRVARVVGGMVGAFVGGHFGSKVGAEYGPAGAIAGTIVVGALGRQVGADAGIAVYEKFIASEQENIADRRERENAHMQETAARAESDAKNSQNIANRAQKDADEAQSEATQAQNEADAWSTAASNAQKKADETGNSSDQKTANEIAKTAAEKQAYADKKKQDAKDAAAIAAAAKEEAERAKKVAEETKKRAEQSKKSSTTLPSGYGQGEVEDTPWGRYVQARMLQYHLRILEMVAKGEDPTTILLNPYADVTSSSPSKTPTTMITERLKLPLDPNTVLVGANTPCFDTKFEMAPEDGLSPTVINPAIYDEPKGGGVPGVPGSPLKTKP